MPTPSAVELIVTQNQERAALYNRRAIDDYFIDLPPLPPPSPAISRNETPDEPKKKVAPDGKTLWCTTTTYTLTNNPDEIVLYSPDVETLWLGALVQGDSLKGIGSFKEVPIDKRAPLDIGVTVLAEDVSATVPHPNAVTLQATIGKMIENLSKKKAKYKSDVSFKLCETYSLDQALMELGLSAHYTGGEFHAKHSAQTSDEKRVMTFSYIEKCFTVFMHNPPSPSALFSSDLSLNDLHLQERLGRISRTNPPVLLTTIAYGRMFYCTISSTASFSELNTSLNASYNAGAGGGDANFKEEHKKILRESNFSVSAIGVPHDNIATLIQTGKLQDFFSQPMDIAIVTPISYVLRNLVELSIASYVNSGEYKMTVCGPRPVGGDVMSHSNASDAGSKNYYNLVEAAASNINDSPTRQQRIRGYRLEHTLLINNLDWLLNKAKELNEDDRDYCKDWSTAMIDKIKERMVIFKSEGDNQPWNRDIYSEAYHLCSEQNSVATALHYAL
jgi:thiol-activated cytolysin